MSFQSFIDYVMGLAKKSKTFVKVQNNREKGIYIAKFTGGVVMYANPKTYMMTTKWAKGAHCMAKNIREEVRKYE